MIFVTVGTELPFDRLIRTIDRWALDQQREDVFAQIGSGAWTPQAIAYAEFLEPPAFMERFTSASLIIAHAGMGTILSALEHGKPILIMPRRASLGEQRNEHQLATARRMQHLGHVEVALDEDALWERLQRLDEVSARTQISSYASDSLIRSLRDFIRQS